MHERDRQTNRRTDGPTDTARRHSPSLCRARRGKKTPLKNEMANKWSFLSTNFKKSGIWTNVIFAMNRRPNRFLCRVAEAKRRGRLCVPPSRRSWTRYRRTSGRWGRTWRWGGLAPRRRTQCSGRACERRGPAAVDELLSRHWTGCWCSEQLHVTRRHTYIHTLYIYCC